MGLSGTLDEIRSWKKLKCTVPTSYGNSASRSLGSFDKSQPSSRICFCICPWIDRFTTSWRQAECKECAWMTRVHREPELEWFMVLSPQQQLTDLPLQYPCLCLFSPSRWTAPSWSTVGSLWHITFPPCSLLCRPILYMSTVPSSTPWWPVTEERSNTIPPLSQARVSPRTTADQKCQSKVQLCSTSICLLRQGASKPLPSAKWKRWKWTTSMMELSGFTMKTWLQRWWLLKMWALFVVRMSRGKKAMLPLAHLYSLSLSCSYKCLPTPWAFRGKLLCKTCGIRQWH